MRRASRWTVLVALVVAVGPLAGCSTSQPRRYETAGQVERLRAAELDAVEVGPLGEPERRRRELADARVALLVAVDDDDVPDGRHRASARRVGEAFVEVVGTQRRPTGAGTRVRFGRALRGASATACVAMADAASARWDGGLVERLVDAGRLDAAEGTAIGDDLREVAVGCSRAPGEQPRG